jgi:hypothetical protein
VQSYITGLDDYGFHRLRYMVTDDSKHLDRSRHICLQSAHREEEEDQPGFDKSPKPCIRLLTASAAASKDSDGNAALNYSAATECLSGIVCAHFGGAVTDNAPDALIETEKTFSLFMEGVQANAEDSYLRNMYGVERRHISNGDMYHIDNLIATHASNYAFGQTERGEHSQVHHCQLLQSLHDIHKHDRIASQSAMDTVIQGTNNDVDDDSDDDLDDNDDQQGV